jgi:hypothetical protein
MVILDQSLPSSEAAMPNFVPMPLMLTTLLIIPGCKQSDEALVAIRGLQQRIGEDMYLKFQEAVCFVWKKEFPEAVRILEELAASDSDLKASVHMELILLYDHLGDRENSLRWHRVKIEANPDNPKPTDAQVEDTNRRFLESFAPDWRVENGLEG